MKIVLWVVCVTLLIQFFVPSTSLSLITSSQLFSLVESTLDACEALGIHGRVLEDGKAAEGQGLILYQFDENSGTSMASAISDDSGCYHFNNIKSLASSQKYRVVFSGLGPALKIGWWFGPIIENYSEGQIVHGGDIDIATLPLLGPQDGLVLQLPVTFTWEKRKVDGDTYGLEFSDLVSDDIWATDDLGDVDTFTLEEPLPGMEIGRQYSWRVVAYQQPDSYGYSRENRSFSFDTQAVPYLYHPVGNSTKKYLLISWQNISWADQYQLDEKRGNGNWITVYQGENNYFKQSGLKDGQYCYRVAAANSQSISGFSNVRCSIVVDGIALTHQSALPIISRN